MPSYWDILANDRGSLNEKDLESLENIPRAFANDPQGLKQYILSDPTQALSDQDVRRLLASRIIQQEQEDTPQPSQAPAPGKRFDGDWVREPNGMLRFKITRQWEE